MIKRPDRRAQQTQTIKLAAKPRWRTTSFWQEMFLYFFFLSIIGRFLEVLYSFIRPLITNGEIWYPARVTLLPSGPPYGLGAVAVILFVVPLMKKYKLNPLIVFILNTIITSTVEYLCAIFIQALYGSNLFWNYSNMPLNINGYWIGYSAAYGVVATLFIYLIYPLCQKLLASLHKRKWLFDLIFWLLFIFYLIEIVMIFTCGAS